MTNNESSHLITRLSPICDCEGRVIGVAKIARDITERKRLERELDKVLQRDPITFTPKANIRSSHSDQEATLTATEIHCIHVFQR